MSKRNFPKKSLQKLKKFHRKLERNGIKAKLHLAAGTSGFNYLHVKSVRLPTNIDVTITPEYEIELSIPYRKYQSSPNTAIDIIFALAKEATA